MSARKIYVARVQNPEWNCKDEVWTVRANGPKEAMAKLRKAASSNVYELSYCPENPVRHMKFR